MNLSPHFASSEFGVTSATPESAILALTSLCVAVLEPIRAHFGPVSIHSGWRSPEANAAAHGASHSQHLSGQAADLHVAGHTIEEVASWLHASPLVYVDQVILETRAGKLPYTWLHCSHIEGKNRDQFLCSLDGKTYAGWKP